MSMDQLPQAETEAVTHAVAVLEQAHGLVGASAGFPVQTSRLKAPATVGGNSPPIVSTTLTGKVGVVAKNCEPAIDAIGDAPIPFGYGHTTFGVRLPCRLNMVNADYYSSLFKDNQWLK